MIHSARATVQSAFIFAWKKEAGWTDMCEPIDQY